MRQAVESAGWHKDCLSISLRKFGDIATSDGWTIAGGPREAEEVPMESLTDSAYVSGHRHRRRHQRVPRRNIVLLALLGIIFLVGIASAVGLIVGYSLHVF
jgi:hypothetical protein